MLINGTFAGSVLLSLCCNAEPISTSELCAALSRQYAASDGKTIEFHYECYFAEGLPCVPESGPPQEALVYEQHGQASRKGSRFRIDLETVRSFEPDDLGARIVRLWGGTDARIADYHKGSSQPHAIAILLKADRSFAMDHYMTWLGWWCFQNEGQNTFIDVANRPSLGAPEMLADGRTQWRGDYFPFGAEVILTARRCDSEVELSEVEIRQYYEGKASPDGNVQSSARYVFGPTRRDRGEFLPSTADVYVCFWQRGDPKDDFWGYARVVLDQITSVSDNETFRIDPGRASTIRDMRYRLAYEQGTQYISLDGRALRTHEPIFGDDVGEKIERWVELGEWLPLAEPIQRLPASSTGPTRSTPQEAPNT